MQQTSSTTMQQTSSTTFCGQVLVLGRPSVGKSTLLNALCGHKASIVAAIPQTTRDIIRIIVSKGDTQVLFLDSPGMHFSEKKYNQFLMGKIHGALHDLDLVLYLLDCSRALGKEEESIMNLLQKTKIPVMVAINKIDTLEEYEESEEKLSLIDKTTLYRVVQERFPRSKIVGISAQAEFGLEELFSAIKEYLPQDAFHYPTDFYTDQNADFRMCELVREAALHFLKDELPHALDIELEQSTVLKTKEDNSIQRRKVEFNLIVERSSQGSIVIGTQGSMIGQIRKLATQFINEVFDYTVQLHLKVQVRKKWRRRSVRPRRSG